MVSFFSWLEYSEAERRKVLDVVHAFGDRDTRDELGIGTVRDAYADLLAPGTSTIQTRLKYFLFIPWLYQRLEKRVHSKSGFGKHEIANLIRNEEVRLINVLADSEDPDGTIGIDARHTLKRLPSSIYWTGMRSWGLRQFSGSQDQYHHVLTRYFRDKKDTKATGNWHPGLPQAPAEFPFAASFRLSKGESEYLRSRVLQKAGETMLAFLFDQASPSDSIEFPWQHPQFGEMPEKLQDTIEHARNFSEVIHGAALLYNKMLAHKANNEELVDRYDLALNEWKELIAEREHILHDWNIAGFWDNAYTTNPRIPARTKLFIDSWREIALNGTVFRERASNSKAQGLIRERERFLKRGQARLYNQRALELWGGAAGTSRLDFRWKTVTRYLKDLQNQAFTQETGNA
ncbi:DUF6361 family protein [Thermodesulfobacteriota bacterium]